MKSHEVFQVSFIKKYLKDVDHAIVLSIVQVELKGEFQLEIQCILERSLLMLWNLSIKQFKVKWKNFCPNEAT